MTRNSPTALIADDEPLLRQSLRRLLADTWPELEVVAETRNGREAIEQFDARQPDVCFLDVRMPGLSGVEAARYIGCGAHLVFVTAYDRYAVQAFEQGAIDYLVKPVEAGRLQETVTRLQERIQAAQPARNAEALLEQLAAHLGKKNRTLRWIRATIGQTLRLIPVDRVDFLRADEKYTSVGWRDEAGKPDVALIRTPLKELLPKLDSAQFAQVHRSVVVNLRAISHIRRGDNQTAEIHLTGRDECLPVSRSYLHLFRQM